MSRSTVSPRASWRQHVDGVLATGKGKGMTQPSDCGVTVYTLYTLYCTYHRGPSSSPTKDNGFIRKKRSTDVSVPNKSQ
ncbi:hypothetical protein E2C01_035970 [Portunus trituberculatus]|uniref:Uncharacterized protein n=1 Tax=Portunus trituberculatus TaxID=210409 RepID=A0A5B7FAQ5_PORTR|nr:hypothetical protein [Portunus trituberculatus]